MSWDVVVVTCPKQSWVSSVREEVDNVLAQVPQTLLPLTSITILIAVWYFCRGGGGGRPWRGGEFFCQLFGLILGAPVSVCHPQVIIDYYE